MKVAQILYSGLGGHGSVVFSMLRGGAHAEWSNSLLFFGIEPVTPAYRAATAALDVRAHAIQVAPGYGWRAWPEVHSWLRAEQPDALIVHSSSTLPPCALYAARHGVPLVFVEHTPTAVKTRADRAFSAMAMCVADGVVMLTQDYVEDSRRAMGAAFRRSRVHVIPNGVDTDTFRPRSKPPRTEVRVGMAARMSPSKRQDLLVRAVAQLAEGPDRSRWLLTLAGDGETREALERLVGDLGLGDRVRFVGMLDEPRLVEWLADLDVYAHASDGETLSTSLLQAMACGVPIVASRIPGITNLLAGPPELASLVTNDARAFADAIPRVLGREGQQLSLIHI